MDRLHAFIPSNPSHHEIYAEHQAKAFVHVDTRAGTWLLERLKGDRPPSLVILTGDAGHGKTHLVRNLLKELGFAEDDLPELLKKECDGRPLERGGHRFAIHKDLSELTPERAAPLLAQAMEDDHPFIACVNEGRLRALLSQDALRDNPLTQAILKGLQEDEIEPAPGLVVVNLNWQMVSLPEGIVARVLKSILDGRKWRVCGDCASAPGCPIFQNRSILAERSDRQEAIRRLYEVAEQLGEVITIRQVMIHLAYLITGNLTCAEVHGFRKDKDRSPYAHTSTLFAEGASPSLLTQLPLLRRLSRLDPGYVARREVDEAFAGREGRSCLPETSPDRRHRRGHLHVDLLRGMGPTGLDIDQSGAAQTEAELLHRSHTILRRHHFLEGGAGEVSGFEHLREYRDLLAGSLKSLDKRRLTARVVEGLHRLQFLPPDLSGLHIVDPISLRARAVTPVISLHLQKSEMELSPEVPPLLQSGQPVVDALPRRLILTVRDHRLHLDLWSFEFLCRCAGGLASRAYFRREIRRLTNFLLKVAQDGAAQAEPNSAKVLYRGREEQIFITDDVIDRN